MSKVMLGFVVGAAVGAVAGILFAPDSGSHTRQKIADKAGEIKDSVSNSVGSLVGSAKDAFSDLKHEAENLGDHAKAKMGAMKNETKNTFS